MNPEENNNPLTNGAGADPVVPDPVVSDTTGTPSPVEPSTDTANPTDIPAENPVGAVDAMPTAETNGPAETAEFVDGSPTDSKDTEETEAEATEEPAEPIEPAAPLPGSIGSAMSGPAVDANPTPTPEVSPVPDMTTASEPTATDAVSQPETPDPTAPLGAVADATPNPVSTEPAASAAPMPTMPGPMAANGTPKAKKSRTTTILLIALAAIAVVAGIVAVILLTQKPEEQPVANNNNTETVVEEDTETSLVCKVSSAESGELIEGIDGLTAYERELVVEYINDELDTIASKDTFTFGDVELASNFSTIQQADYVNSYTSLGFDTDPFKSNFKVSETIATITHSAKFDELNVKNMAIFSLQSDEEDNIKTSVASIKKIYEKLGYKCTISEGEEEEEESEEVEEVTEATEEE